jgi:hypothetical protein
MSVTRVLQDFKRVILKFRRVLQEYDKSVLPSHSRATRSPWHTVVFKERYLSVTRGLQEFKRVKKVLHECYKIVTRAVAQRSSSKVYLA